ncbi:hypothetical protein KSP39_PZI005851 [Platanthera zijinensis]|uniref:Uncharacterized protein n=1 Tax=Platanthera zijinensis TaxID=2320716 RepID=A0AAP0GAS7_9ASPA
MKLRDDLECLKKIRSQNVQTLKQCQPNHRRHQQRRPNHRRHRTVSSNDESSAMMKYL